MRKIVLIIGLIFTISSIVLAQKTSEVTANGLGGSREDALQDALRNAVGQAVGVEVKSQSQVENFLLVKDIIDTRTQGYIASYKITKEGKTSIAYEMTVAAIVSLDPLKADIAYLSRALGGVRFLVMYDERQKDKTMIPYYDFAVERMNQALSERKFRYIEKRRFESLKAEALGIMQENDTNEISYVQKLGILSDAQFIMVVSNISTMSKSEAFDTRNSSKVLIEVKIYDNCTAEGLGTVVLESEYQDATDIVSGYKAGISEAAKRDFDKMIIPFNSYLGEWINNGTPYELRFYGTGTFRDFRELRNMLKEDSQFGGQLEVTSVNNYTKLNCTFKKKPDELADIILDYADKIPAFAAKKLDVKFIYGRQVSFAPQAMVVPGLPTKPIANIEKPKPSVVSKPTTQVTKPKTPVKKAITQEKKPVVKKSSINNSTPTKKK